MALSSGFLHRTRERFQTGFLANRPLTGLNEWSSGCLQNALSLHQLFFKMPHAVGRTHAAWSRTPMLLGSTTAVSTLLPPFRVEVGGAGEIFPEELLSPAKENA